MKHNLAIFPDHRVAIKQVEDFNKRFARPVLVKTEKEPQMVYTRRSRRFSLPEVLRRIVNVKLDEGLTADEVRESLYPRSSK